MITPLAMFHPYPKVSPSRSLNYAANKPKGAITYVTAGPSGTTDSSLWKLVEASGKYIPVYLW